MALQRTLQDAPQAIWSPQQVQSQRELAAALLQNDQPITNWAEGLNALAEGFIGGQKRRRAERDETAGRTRRSEALAGLLSGSGMGSSAPAGFGMSSLGTSTTNAPAQAASIPQGDRASYIRQGLISRGLPGHVADGFLANFKDESGLDPGINERNPIVPGSRGGFGLYQLTGPRRREYEAFASQRGVAPGDIDAQLDFLVGELQGSERRAGQRILSAPDTASAAQAIVNDFLRPAASHRQSRAARYAGLPTQQFEEARSLQAAYAPQQGVQVASADGSGPSAETMDALMSGVNTSRASRGEAPMPMAQAPSYQPAPYQPPQQQMAQMLLGQGGSTDIGALLNDPWTADLGEMLLTNQLQSRQAREQALLEQQLQAQDPYRQLQMENLRSQIDERNRPEAVEPIEVGGVLLDPQTYQPIFDSRTPSDGGFTLSAGQQRFDAQGNPIASVSEAPAFRVATPEEAAVYGAPAGQFGPDGRFYPNNPPSGMSIQSDGQGGFRMVQGPGAQSATLTEGQSKDTVYATRAEGSLPLIDQYENALTSRADQALGIIPMGVGREFQSTDFQLGRQAGDEFLQAILRKDTGAAITADEQSLYGDTYLPRPGDSPELIAQKRQSRRRALEAIKAGLPPTAIIQQELALQRSGSPSMAPAPISAGIGSPSNPIQLDTVTVPAGVDPQDWEFMSPEERALFQ